MKIYSILLILFIYLNIMKADFSTNLWESTYSLSYNGDGYIFPYPEECATILDAFADYASNFTKCSILYARPIKLCEQCIEQYVNFHNKYQELLTTVVNGTSCKSIFISHDRLDAILDHHDSILAIWDKGHCSACFDWNQEKPELSNNTKKFNKMFQETKDCIVKNLNPATNNSDEVCQTCMISYIQLNDFYKSLSADSIGVDSICMDIVDSMNATRSVWSKSLNCCHLRKSPEIVFLCCSAIIAMLPLLYYVAVRYCGPIRDLPNVLKQTRFKQIILRSSNGRTN